MTPGEAMNFQAILVATDFSECSGAAFQAAQKLARTFQAKLILVHVISLRRLEALSEFMHLEPDTLIPKLKQRAEARLDEFLQRYGGGDLSPESVVAVGLPFQEIAVLARDLAVDLIVLGGYGSAGRGPIEEVFFGSTAEKVVRLLPCPVLVVPGPPSES
ncbi:MAG: universal stress protein [Desulfobaccales bacterium]